MTKLNLIFIFLLTFQLSNAQFFTDKLEVLKFEGFFDYYYDKNEDKIFLQVDKIDQEFLYVHSLS